MNRIIFPLSPGMKGSAVVDLQAVLRLCLDRSAILSKDPDARKELSSKLEAERVEQTYGEITTNLVIVFQEERGLKASGEVDEPTANGLNALLKELGLLDQPVQPQAVCSDIVSGQVRREDGLPLQNMRVRAVHETDTRAGGALRLGEDTTDANGRYTIRYEPLPGVDGINLRVIVFDSDSKPLHASEVIRGAKPLEIVDLILLSDEVKSYRVEGRVASRISVGIGGLYVLIVDKGVGGDVKLTQARTSDSGDYWATFSDTEIRRRGKAQPDLQARVFADQIFQNFLGASDVHYNASQHETLNVILEDKAASALHSEHEVLTSTLATQYRGRLRDLKETDDQQDITYLANKTGWDARAVALAALADQFSVQTADKSGAPTIPQPYFYALFRAGLPANEDTLYHTDAKTLEAVWTKAAEQGVIPKTSADQIANLVSQFQALSAQKLLMEPALIGASSFKEMLTASGLNDAQQGTFAQLYALHSTDMPTFWKAVGDAFGQASANRLQLDGKLGFLTVNNAPLMQKVHTIVGEKGLSDPLQLAQMGYYRAEMWGPLLTEDVPIPKEIPGDTDTQRANYASYLAAQVRLSYPTAAVAHMIKSGELPLKGAASGIPDRVHNFRTEHHGKFEIGVQPIAQYIADNKLQGVEETAKQIARVQRVYQITPSDHAMIGLMKHDIDSAYHVVRYDKNTFVHSLAADVGGADQAALIYDRSVQVHNVVLNIALSYLYARTSPAIGVHSPAGSLDPTPANPGDVIAYATLESLFGSMDFCTCDHCRSILSPAAYLVDLLQFLDADDKVWDDFISTWKSSEGGHDGARYPFNNQDSWNKYQQDWNSNNPGQPLPDTEISPFNVLKSRRPDIQNLPLTCENTNTALPYIDVVNETLEYYIVNGLTLEENALAEYLGHDTNGVASEDLLASPQFVMDAAYTTLRGERFPAPLPFHQPLENLRRYFGKFEVPLPLAMERLRKSDDLERGANPYGWRDILMEEVGLSRDEYEILTTSKVAPDDDKQLWQIYGYPSGTNDPDVINGNQAANIVALSNAKRFCRRVGITYDDLVSLLRTRFINPNSDLIPKLERLGVSFATLKALKDGHFPDGTPFSPSDFNNKLAELAVPPDPAEYDDDIAGWVIQPDNYNRIMGLITLEVAVSTWTHNKVYAAGDCVLPTKPQTGSTFYYYECTTAGTSAAAEPTTWPTTPGDTCNDGTVQWTCRDPSSCHSFDNMAFRYCDPAKILQNIDAVEFVRLLRFIRLWKKLGWTIEQTDAAICALYPTPAPPQTFADVVDTVGELDEGFLTLLPRLGLVKRVMKALNLTPKRDLLPLLACFALIDTHEGAEWVMDEDKGSTLQTLPSLYRQLFLNPTILTQDPVFKDNGYGEYLQDESQKLLTLGSLQKAVVAGTIKVGDVLTTTINGVQIPYTVVDADTTTTILATNIVTAINTTTTADPMSGLPLNQVILASNSSGVITIQALNPENSFTLACSVSLGATETYMPLNHEPALRAALNLTSDEFSQITQTLAFNETTPLNLANISAIFRRGWLARKLKISVRELLRFMQLTGLDPFAAPDPTNPAILRLIFLVQALKDRSVKSAVALYLIWNQDLSGKSAPDPAQIAELARSLRGDFAAINDQFAVVEDPNGDVARARVSLVYGQETSDTFFALLDDTLMVDVEYTQAADTLETAITAVDPRIAYDAFRHRLAHTGLMTTGPTGMQTALKNVPGVSDDFKNAVDALSARSEDAVGSFFARNPELQPPYDEVASLDGTSVGAVDYGQIAQTLAAITAADSRITYDNTHHRLGQWVDYTHPEPTLALAITAADSQITYDNANHRLAYSGVLTAARRDMLKGVPDVAPEFQSAVDALFTLSQKARGAVVLAALQPGLARRRKRQQAMQRLSAAAGVDLTFTQTMLDPATGPYPLHAAGDPNQPALVDVLALETPGLAVQFFFHDTATGNPDQSVPAAPSLDYAKGGSNPLPSPGNAISGIWSGRVEAPEAGFYNFIIQADSGATVTLTLGGEMYTVKNSKLVQNGNIARNAETIELKAGTLYAIELKVENVQDALSLKWETPKRAREVIPSRYLYPPTILEPFSNSYVRFLKAVSLATALTLTANELAHLATHSDYLINADRWLNALVVTGDPDTATAKALLKPFKAMLDFARIKADISPSDESLLAILKDPTTATQKVDSLLYVITRWNSISLNDMLAQFGKSIGELESFDLFRRIYDAFALTEKMGISAQALIQATTNEPAGDTVRNLQAALRARYDPADWRDVVRPINDETRGLQRDALVAYILHQMQSHPESAHIDAPNKLFEYFLMDVEMDPCMQTSRIRHALSSVQLFIERCLMNLEPRVSPAFFDGNGDDKGSPSKRKQWEWMKRYRVWEANRKVFLWPENWLEPELREDQSPLFKEGMSELLQSEITEERAAITLLNYLTKLEQVAKLEPCGIHYIPGDNNKNKSEITHVIARTPGAHRKYYYRRKENGYWTPWEQIQLDIEDNPVIPVVWKDRLLLFWLRILKKGPDNVKLPFSTKGDLSTLKENNIDTNPPKLTVHAILCWSEYHNGKWQPAKTSDVDWPAGLMESYNSGEWLHQFDATGDKAFNRATLSMRAVREKEASLPEAGEVLRINFWGDGWSNYRLYNTHSLPLRREDSDEAAFKPSISEKFTRSFPSSWTNWMHGQSLTIKYSGNSQSDSTQEVLSKTIPSRVIPPMHPLENAWDAPFFHEDRRHVFYVTTEEQAATLRDPGGYGISINPDMFLITEIPQLVVQPGPPLPQRLWGDGGPVDPGLSDNDPSRMQQLVTEDAYIHQGFGTISTVMYSNQRIGPAGSMLNGAGAERSEI